MKVSSCPTRFMSTKEAAWLLCDLRRIAVAEIKKEQRRLVIIQEMSKWNRSNSTLQESGFSLEEFETQSSESSLSSTLTPPSCDIENLLTIQKRRTVSLGSHDLVTAQANPPPTVAASTMAVIHKSSITPLRKPSLPSISASVEINTNRSSLRTNKSTPSISPSFTEIALQRKNIMSAQMIFVGTHAKGETKAVLRKKFSWKNFPELEAFLVANREEYLRYSSSSNYTTEQKQYNNTLTQKLLDLASQVGYVFEGFTFGMVRDRIRCYYKSYVQASKKKRLQQQRQAALKQKQLQQNK